MASFDYSGHTKADAVLEEPSHLIAMRMLQGWALLDKACEDGCGGDTPLLRDPKTHQVSASLCVRRGFDGCFDCSGLLRGVRLSCAASC